MMIPKTAASLATTVLLLTAATHPTSTNAFGTTDRRTWFRQVLSTTTALVAPVLPASAASPFSPGGKIRFGDESLMDQKAHGTSATPVQTDLLYGVSNKLADRICNYNRHFAEQAGYYYRDTPFEAVLQEQLSKNNQGQPVTFYDSNSGKPLFVAPVNRSLQDFLDESRLHGWPSFRDDEVVWDNVRVLRNSGETVSVDGTHLGHDLPDRQGNRYCINLVSIAGRPQ